MTPQPDGEAERAASADTSGPQAPIVARQAAGIYGLIVTAAVIASAGGQLRTAALVVAVFVTLVVYWLAEEYARLGEHASAGHLPTWPSIRSALAVKWPMVSASYLPLLALVGARLLGASAPAAAYFALSLTVVMLTYYGWSAGRASGLRGGALLLMTAAASALGLLMILLKIVIAHLH
ncbi:MAG: hypothetical protein JWO63_395 [Frankiales bacterium]|nr:hypothetical protein [Frankiales bacterium]